MSLVNNIDKAFKENIARNYEGLSHNATGVYIKLGDLNIALLDKNCKVMENRMSELSEPIRRELSGQYDSSEELMKAFVARAKSEIESFFVQVAESWIDGLKAKAEAESRIVAVYEQRNMVDFIQDSGFKNNARNKRAEITETIKSFGINLKVEYVQSAEVNRFKLMLEDCMAKYDSIVEAYDTFLVLMKDMVELTKKVKNSKSANPNASAKALENLSLINEISYEDMQLLPTKINLDLEKQKQLLTVSLSKAEFINLLK